MSNSSAAEHSHSGISLKVYREIMPHAPIRYFHPLEKAMRRYHITTPKRVSAFLSQIAVESKQLRHTHELWTTRKDFQLPGVQRSKFTATNAKEYFEHWYGNRSKGLGNTTAEDGYTYRGRGAIQITGKANYESIGKGIGKPLLEHPELLETDPAIDMLASAYYFSVRARLLHVADRVDSSNEHSVYLTNLHLTKGVNGGLNGLDERLHHYKKALLHFDMIKTMSPKSRL
jgi:putative chitinase